MGGGSSKARSVMEREIQILAIKEFLEKLPAALGMEGESVSFDDLLSQASLLSEQVAADAILVKQLQDDLIEANRITGTWVDYCDRLKRGVE